MNLTDLPDDILIELMTYNYKFNTTNKHLYELYSNNKDYILNRFPIVTFCPYGGDPEMSIINLKQRFPKGIRCDQQYL